MKRVKANTLTYDADVGRIEPGQVYTIDDAKADRWVTSGIAAEEPDPEPEPEPEPAPQPAPPKPEEEEDEGEEEEDEGGGEEDEKLAAEAKRLHASGASQRTIAEELGITRAAVRRLLAD